MVYILSHYYRETMHEPTSLLIMLYIKVACQLYNVFGNVCRIRKFIMENKHRNNKKWSNTAYL